MLKTLTRSRTAAICALFALMVFVLVRCAVRRAPPGGPVDDIAPQVVAVFPAPDSTNVLEPDYMEITFDEAINQATAINQVWLLPEVEGGLEIEWKGDRRLRILPASPLERDQTYILTVGTGLKDMRNNPLKRPIVVPFSTGPEIDRAEISGRVGGEGLQGVYVYAYELNDSAVADSLLRKKPRYYTQVDDQGMFQLGYLKQGAYRVFALEDANQDRVYTLQADRIGLPARDVVLDSVISRYAGLNFSLVREDTLPPRLVKAEAVHRRLVKVTLNEKTLRPEVRSISIRDTLTNRELALMGVGYAEGDSSGLLLFTASQENVPYAITLEGATDLAGNRTPGILTSMLRGSDAADTTSAQIVNISPGPNQANLPGDVRVEIALNAPVDTMSLIEAFQMADTTSQPVQGDWDFSSLVRPVFVPRELSRAMTYEYRIDFNRVSSLYGSSFPDTLYRVRFGTRPADMLGGISGMVAGQDTASAAALVTLAAYTGGVRLTRTVPVNSPFDLQEIPEGRYRMRAVLDQNGNGKYDRGSTVPFTFAEPFIIYPDTVRVRKRWTTEGIRFNF